MKTKVSLFLSILFIVGIACVFYQLSDSKIGENEMEFEEGALRPNDWQFRQRAYPSGKIDVKAYKKAVRYRNEKVAQQKLVTQNTNEWTFEGPTNIGGRITDIEITSDESAILVGAASGGIFKSEDDGISWTVVSNEEMSLSIGDIAIAPSDDNVMYVGTGEPNAGGGSLVYEGNGVHKSTDKGNTWTHLGLDTIGSVGKVVVSAADPNICFVGAMGYLFEKGNNRGVYRTVDGGTTWDQVLFVNDSTGIVDMAIHPTNPNIVYAAAWERVREVNRRSYGGASSGIYRSEDGGSTWEKLNEGLPVNAGRIGIAIAPSAPETLYAFYADAVSGYIEGLYKTTNGGNSWTAVSSSGISDVPYIWWFGKIFVDPNDANTVFVASFEMHKSTNGGASWTTIFGGAHVDQHALCVYPQNPDKILAGNDGGLYVSNNGGSSYNKIDGLPITQFYTCEIDYAAPERLYGGTQDNSTMRTLIGGVDDWSIIYVGDGFRTQVDPNDNNIIYTEYQYGNIARSTNGGSSFSAVMSGIAEADRKNWNTPFILSPTNSDVLYYGANRLYKSDNQANSWTAISPDLTTNPTQYNLTYGTITAISVSAINEDVVFVGTDDGNVQVSTDDGGTWTLVSADLPNRWVTSVAVDPNDESGAYVAFSGYRYGENIGHIYYTADLGTTWMDITGDLPDIPINDLIVTPENNDLYVATDVGVFYSINQGENWEVLGTELPNVVITDISYHEPTNMLVAASYGRGLFSVDLTFELPSSISVTSINKEINAKVFPNPFSAKTNLTLALKTSKDYQINLLNADGRLVQTIYKGYLEQGSHQFEVEGNSLKNGLYICQIVNAKGRLQDEIRLLKQ